MYKKILIYVIVLFIIIVIARIFAGVVKPIIKDTKPLYNNFIDYMNIVYCPNQKCPTGTLPYPIELIIYKDDDKYLTRSNEEAREKKIIESQINIMNTLKYFNFIYDSGPKSILDNYPSAENLSFCWPPKMGSRYKLTAFPYPKSKFILSAVYDTISNTVDAYTFPGWMIQRRNPLNFNNSIYNKNYFRDYQDIEVLHACYPPPGYKYPYCDDGGYWLYLATGTGVFWNTGKCVVSLNKLSLLYDLYNCSLKTRRTISSPSSKISPPILGLSIQDMVDRFEGKGGGYSMMIAIFTIVNALNTNTVKDLKITGFRNMTPSDKGGAAWDNFITRTFLILYLLVVTIIQLFVNIRNKSKKGVIIVILTTLIILVALIIFYLFVIFEDFFRGLGWMTLDMALKETNMTLYQFIEECVLGTQQNPICNSLAMTQTFDIDVQVYTHAMKYESFILTSQPNKTGTWEVEICDLRYFDKDNLIYKDGICGTYDKKNVINEPVKIDLCKNKILPPKKNNIILKSGPIVLDTKGPPYYKPTESCMCIEGSKRLCVSCKGYLSEKLCINK